MRRIARETRRILRKLCGFFPAGSSPTRGPGNLLRSPLGISAGPGEGGRGGGERVGNSLQERTSGETSAREEEVRRCSGLERGSRDTGLIPLPLAGRCSLSLSPSSRASCALPVPLLLPPLLPRRHSRLPPRREQAESFSVRPSVRPSLPPPARCPCVYHAAHVGVHPTDSESTDVESAASLLADPYRARRRRAIRCGGRAPVTLLLRDGFGSMPALFRSGEKSARASVPAGRYRDALGFRFAMYFASSPTTRWGSRRCDRLEIEKRNSFSRVTFIAGVVCASCALSARAKHQAR